MARFIKKNGQVVPINPTPTANLLSRLGDTMLGRFVIRAGQGNPVSLAGEGESPPTWIGWWKNGDIGEGMTNRRGWLGYGSSGTDQFSIRNETGGSLVLSSGSNRVIIESKEAWQTPTFQNGWSNYGGSYSVAGYRRDAENRVYLKGLVRFGTISASTTGTIFTLPVGYRPAEIQLLSTISTVTTPSRVDVTTAGNVIANSGNNGWFALDGLSFDAA